MRTTTAPARRRIRRALIGGAAVAALTLTGACSSGGGNDGTADGPQAQSELAVEIATNVSEPQVPVSITVDGAQAPIDAINTTEDGVLHAPQDVGRIGWWAGSAMIGAEEGTTVLTGHVDEVDQGTGFAGAHFAGLELGQTVTVTSADGTEYVYEVTENDRVEKRGALPLERLNDLDGEPELALITCGGEFVGPPLGYEDNQIVWLRPA